ncbi:MAG: proton-conducting transporter membrane subunit [Lachnospiraceae bacterium]|nr:proton-conducting transporter membrane subunit [Lachnospiraceae bacterium]
MNFITNFPLFTIVLSLFSGVLCTMLSGKNARRYTVIYECVLIAMAASVLFYTARTGAAFTYVMGEFPAPWGNEIRAGVLESLMALVFMTVMMSSVAGGAEYVDFDIDSEKRNLYYALINLMTAAMMALLWTNDIFTGYVFLEIMTLTSCGILIVREVGRTTLAAIRYMILNLLGSGLFLLGIVLLYDITGNLLMVPMHSAIERLAQDPRNFVALTMALGILTTGLSIKCGLFPFHFWMPDTYGAATPTSGAVLSSLVSKCYILLLLKIYFRVIGVEIFETMQIRNILMVLGMLGIVIGSVNAIRVNNINHMVAFSSAAQIGYIFMGIGIGGTAGYTAAVFHILSHCVTKSLLFLTTPRLAAVSGNSLRFKNLQGSGLMDPEAGVFFGAASLSMIGIPVFAGFVSKLLFVTAAVECGSTKKLIFVIVVLAISSVLNALYFIRTLIRIFAERNTDRADKVRHSAAYLISMGVLVALNISLGIVSPVFTDLIKKGLGMFG